MDSDTKSLLISIVGSIIGAALLYYTLIKPAQQSNQYQMQNRIQQLEFQLQQQQEYQQQQYRQSHQSLTTPNSYKNAEKWEITRNKDGFISNIRVSRDARITN